MNRRFPHLVLAAAAISLSLTGCSDDSSSSDTTSKASSGGDCATALKAQGKLTVATGEPAFPPWVEDDKPESGKGFESAVVYAVADQMGIDKAKVSWVRTGFDEAVAPGEKDYDFNVQQYSITDDRKKVVDFSDSYYEVQQAIIGRADGPLAKVTSLADLKDARLGAAVGTTSLDYVENYIKPTTQALVFDDNAAAKAAFDAKQVDGIVLDVPTAYYVTAAEIEDASIIGILPSQGDAEQLGMLFEKGSKLVSCVDKALATLKGDGTLTALQTEWLSQGGDIPTLTK